MPFGTDPVMATAQAYKLCAGHGVWNGSSADGGCDCFADPERGYWASDVEDASVSTTCRICLHAGLGPKPKTIADRFARCVNRACPAKIVGDGEEAALDCGDTSHCAEEMGRMHACALPGQMDAERAFVASAGEADVTWRLCGGHGHWNGTSCVCARGWALGENDPLYELPFLQSCNRCDDAVRIGNETVAYGPPPPAQDYEDWRDWVARAQVDGATSYPWHDPPFCAAPFAGGQLCSGHGEVTQQWWVRFDLSRSNCLCHHDEDRGFWAGAACDRCATANATTARNCTDPQ